MICKTNFRTSEGMKFEAGQPYDISPMIGEPRLKLFKVEHTTGGSFVTTEAHINKFFTEKK